MVKTFSMCKKSDEENIEWKSNGLECWIYPNNNNIGYKGYSLRGALRKHLESYIKNICNYSYEFYYNPNYKLRLPSENCFMYVIPKLTKKYDEYIRDDLIREFCKKYVPLYLRSLKIDDNVCNALFMGILGINGRNPIEDCVICLGCGEICNCGNRSTLIFRPCGHNVCNYPCFYNYNKKNEGKCPVCKEGYTSYFVSNFAYLNSDIIDYFEMLFNNEYPDFYIL
jgi:hypothetical protein